MIWLLFYLLAISLYDLHTHRIPNWCTLPLMLTGLVAHFPGTLDVWLACFLFLSIWAAGWMGAGDVKLWMALLWALPETNIPSLLLTIFLSLVLTCILQLSWRLIRMAPLSGLRSPAAWRIIPFFLMFWHAH